MVTRISKIIALLEISMINISNVSFRYFSTQKAILEDFSLQIRKGELVGIVGPTGSGKSTICYLFNGLIPHAFTGDFKGSISVAGLNPEKETVEKMSGYVGLMLQEPSFQMASPFVESEIAFGMENFAVPREEMKRRMDKVTKLLDITHLRKRATANLSEGEKQRVILASILAMEPEILVLDECSSMLDLSSKNKLATTLRELHEDGLTIILTDHDLDFLYSLVSRVLLVNQGEIIADGSPQELLTDIDLLKKNGLIPPFLVSLFHELKEQGLPVTTYPSDYSEAEKILRSWLR
ncbi:MAG: ATP-binding cassette domain-containing protein [Candidatus Heimdallarchaeota archaeon]|nr:ATP-binding cassette domain-containing protein [Candidatus Heimdallarchaeota archaeon]